MIKTFHDHNHLVYSVTGFVSDLCYGITDNDEEVTILKWADKDHIKLYSLWNALEKVV